MYPSPTPPPVMVYTTLRSTRLIPGHHVTDSGKPASTHTPTGGGHHSGVGGDLGGSCSCRPLHAPAMRCNKRPSTTTPPQHGRAIRASGSRRTAFSSFAIIILLVARRTPRTFHGHQGPRAFIPTSLVHPHPAPQCPPASSSGCTPASRMNRRYSRKCCAANTSAMPITVSQLPEHPQQLLMVQRPQHRAHDHAARSRMPYRSR